MFSLCTSVENIIIDLESLNNSYLENSKFIDLLLEIKEEYNLFLFGNGLHNIEGFMIIERSLTDFDSFSTFLNEFGIVPMHSIFMTSSTLYIEQAHAFNISTVLLTEKVETIDHKHLPDKILNIERLRRLLIKKEILGNFNELSIEKTGGMGIVCKIGEIKHILLEDVKANLMFAGRYFIHNDPRSYTHCLSNMLLRLKKSKQYAADALAFCLNANINITKSIMKDINLITVVPGKPGCDNHLDLLMNHRQLDNHRNYIDTNLLFTVKDYKKQKQAGSFTERALNVLNAFDARKNINGHVLLVDDILTSGSTTMECAKVLYKYGAEKVTILPLAIMQSNSNAPYHDKITDLYEEDYRLNFKKSDGEPFWVASDREFLNYNIGKKRFLRQNSYKDFQYEELPF